jgi:hypothetical protein
MNDDTLSSWVPGPGYAKIIELMREQDEQAERERTTAAAAKPLPEQPPADATRADNDDGTTAQ